MTIYHADIEMRVQFMTFVMQYVITTTAVDFRIGSYVDYCVLLSKYELILDPVHSVRWELSSQFDRNCLR